MDSGVDFLSPFYFFRQISFEIDCFKNMFSARFRLTKTFYSYVLTSYFNRYFAIVHPLKDRTRNKKRTTCWALIIIWLLSMALALPFAIKTTLKVVPLNIEENGVVTKRELSFLDTKMDINNFRIYYLTLFISLHIVPFVSMAALYTRIAWQLWKRSKDLTAQTHNNPTEGTKNTPRMSERNRRRTTKMVIAVLLAFFICFFPFHIYYLTILLGDGYKTPDPTTTLVLRLLLILNAAVNPIIYNLLSENFRAAFRAMCACGTRENRGSSVASLEDGLRSIGNSGYN